jgi:hypothetical protein
MLLPDDEQVKVQNYLTCEINLPRAGSQRFVFPNILEDKEGVLWVVHYDVSLEIQKYKLVPGLVDVRQKHKCGRVGVYQRKG